MTATNRAEIGHPAVPGEPGLPRLLPSRAHAQGVLEPGLDLVAHSRRHGRAGIRGSALIGQVDAAGLTGRGGAAFPVARKLSAVASAGGSPVVVANGAEGEPVSSKDAALLWFAPHLVLDGLQLAAEAVGARTAYLYMHAGRDARGGPDLPSHLHAAMAQRAAAGTDRATVQLIEAPPRFLAGEETALVSLINGGPARPADKQHRPFQRGIGGRPTLVQNVETLAHLALIARHGAAWFRSVGTRTEPGSMLCTIRESDGQVRVAEAALGTPLSWLLRLGDEVQAVLSGGYHGGWLTLTDARRVALCNAELRPAGAIAGAGVLVALPAAHCGLAETASVARSLALESAGQCGPCFNGLPAIAAALAELAQPRPAGRALANLQRWAGLVTGRGACHHPDGTVRFVASALSVFGAEIAVHARGRCTATRSDLFLPVTAPALAESDWR
ncbi:MAG TPA: NADH-ubiquinone oxidoreductase-F iron-sulfur binding region domain-containing protein [Streptosporangiaceae bacterium]|nr:NADH-ubiquinone oxidoreductase-F iron-sulfur binding region domain-containing protein [Streptosporangiaceae bacterium]